MNDENNDENNDELELDVESKDDIEGFTFFINDENYTILDFFKNPYKFIDKNLFYINWFQFEDLISLNIIYRKQLRKEFNLYPGIFLLYRLDEFKNRHSTNFALYNLVNSYSMEKIYHLSNEANIDIIQKFTDLQVNGKNEQRLLSAILPEYDTISSEYCMALEEDCNTLDQSQLRIFKRIHTRSCVHVILNEGYISVEKLDPLQGIIATAVSIATENNTVLSPRLLFEGTRNNSEFWIKEIEALVAGINSTPDLYKKAYLFYYILYAFSDIAQANRDKLIPIISKLSRNVLNFAFKNVDKFNYEHDVLRDFLINNEDQERFLYYWKRGQKEFNVKRSYEEIVFNASEAWKRFDDMDW